jgi:hypothetical protein
LIPGNYRLRDFNTHWKFPRRGWCKWLRPGISFSRITRYGQIDLDDADQAIDAVVGFIAAIDGTYSGTDSSEERHKYISLALPGSFDRQ